eukprot:14648976-Heterocapsa_arctica.AAC.1
MEGPNRLGGLWTDQPGRPFTGVRCGRKNDHTRIDHENRNKVVQGNRKQNRDTHLQRVRCKENKTVYTQ